MRKKIGKTGSLDDFKDKVETLSNKSKPNPVSERKVTNQTKSTKASALNYVSSMSNVNYVKYVGYMSYIGYMRYTSI